MIVVWCAKFIYEYCVIYVGEVFFTMTKKLRGRGSRSAEEGNMKKFAEKAGLPTKKEIMNDIDEQVGNLPVSMAVDAKIERIERFVRAQELLHRVVSAQRFQIANSLHSLVDLQEKLWALEEKLQAEGKNPLESPEWMKAREMVAKEQQFIQKHGLEGAKFEQELRKQHAKDGEDIMFEVHNE